MRSADPSTTIRFPPLTWGRSQSRPSSTKSSHTTLAPNSREGSSLRRRAESGRTGTVPWALIEPVAELVARRSKTTSVESLSARSVTEPSSISASASSRTSTSIRNRGPLTAPRSRHRPSRIPRGSAASGSGASVATAARSIASRFAETSISPSKSNPPPPEIDPNEPATDTSVRRSESGVTRISNGASSAMSCPRTPRARSVTVPSIAYAPATSPSTVADALTLPVSSQNSRSESGTTRSRSRSTSSSDAR